MDNLTRIMADRVIALTYVHPPEKEKRKVGSKKKSKHVLDTMPPAPPSRQVLRAKARARAKVERSAMKRAARLYDKVAA